MSSRQGSSAPRTCPLAAERAGPYVRALAAALEAAAPHEDYVPLREATDHLHALDPAIAGPLLEPAEHDAESGMPAFPWLDRARAEQVVARESRPITVDEVQRARRLDPELGARMGARRSLHAHLLDARLLPTTRLSVQLRRLLRSTDFALVYDRVEPRGTWLRIRAEIRLPRGRRSAGSVELVGEDEVRVDPGLIHLITRHSPTPLLALQEQLELASDGTIVRLARSRIGPFWFPGVPLPSGVPEALGRGLVLHLATEVVADDVHTSGHTDPLRPQDPRERPRDGQGLYRTRQFAAHPAQVEAVHAWCASAGVKTTVRALKLG